MKKFFLFSVLLCACFLTRLSAQPTVNKTYTLPGYVLDIDAQTAPSENYNYIYLTANAREINTGQQRLLLIQTDLAGVPIKSIVINELFGWHQIVETDDGGVLAVSYAPGGDGYCAVKYDNNFTQQWRTKIATSTNANGLSNVSHSGIDVVALYCNDNSQENYFIAVTAATDQQPEYENYESVISAARLDAGGGVIWKNEYLDINKGASPYDTWENVRNITPVPDGNGGWELVIAGTREDFDPWTWADGLRLSFLKIEYTAGNVTTLYSAITTYSHTPHRPDIVWDDTRNCYAITYTESPQPSAGPIASVIGFMQLDNALNPIATTERHYHAADENYGLGITLHYSDKNYLLSAVVMGVVNTAMYIKIDGNTITPVWHYGYNLGTAQLPFTPHRTSQSEYNYIMSRKGQDIRFIKADNAGKACGQRHVDLPEEKFTASVDKLEYEPHDLDVENVYISETEVYPTYTICENSSNHNTYKQIGQQQSGEENEIRLSAPHGYIVSISPTLIDNNSGEVKGTIMSSEAGAVSLSVINSIGQIVFTGQVQTVVGTSNFSISSQNLSSGLNIIRVMKGNKILNTTKVMVAQ